MRHSLTSLAPLALAALLGAGAAQAATVTVALNHTTRLALAGPAASVVVGNPAVADVTVVDSRTVFVSGRGPGSTDVSVLDPIGRTLFSGDVRVTTQPGAHVTVHRGVTTVADMACDPTCTAAAAPAPGAGGGGAAPGGLGILGNAATGAMTGAVAGAVGGAATQVPNAMTAGLLSHTS